ncbi:hypothetical protein NPIL_651681 [Nephila pilipes]|uniref:Uncharacterized protein n=1 Tax=Nephila pilipes TaxID=299642 RepID=A0A8X6IX16_NEPPI|nr:hypothetical protein NPIL_331001 [Nephila pilipes]GFT18580.1 hypothetical protein NPIL_651681 [Nephila pilipes]
MMKCYCFIKCAYLISFQNSRTKHDGEKEISSEEDERLKIAFPSIPYSEEFSKTTVQNKVNSTEISLTTICFHLYGFSIISLQTSPINKIMHTAITTEFYPY